MTDNIQPFIREHSKRKNLQNGNGRRRLTNRRGPGHLSFELPYRTAAPRHPSIVRRLLVEPTDNTAVQFLRYGFVGGIAFVADFASLFVLTDSLGLWYMYSAAVAFLVGLTTNYALSVAWVFNRRTILNRTAEFAVFGILGVLGLGINQVGLYALTEGIGLHYLVSKIVTTIAVFFWNFGSRKAILFSIHEMP
ncbi:MAG: GtrA family protein [Pirellulaceae bacterium]